MVSGYSSEPVFSQRNRYHRVWNDVVILVYLSTVESNWSATLDKKGESKNKKREWERGRGAFVECLICSVSVTILAIYFIYI